MTTVTQEPPHTRSAASYLDADTIGRMQALPATWWAFMLGVSEKTVKRLWSRTHTATPVLTRLIAFTLADPEAAERIARLGPVTATELEAKRQLWRLDRRRFAHLLAMSQHEYNKQMSDASLLRAKKPSWHRLARWVTDVIEE